jgi:hypothetical protein
VLPMGLRSLQSAIVKRVQIDRRIFIPVSEYYYIAFGYFVDGTTVPSTMPEIRMSEYTYGSVDPVIFKSDEV